MVPSLADLLGAGFSATMVRVTSEPAGMTTRPSAVVMASPILAVNVSPGLLVREVMERSADASITVPLASSAAAREGGAGAGAGDGAAAGAPAGGFRRGADVGRAAEGGAPGAGRSLIAVC